MRKRNSKILLATSLALSMVVTGFGSTANVSVKAAEDDETILTKVLGADDISLRYNWDDTSNVGEAKTFTLANGVTVTSKDNGTMRPELSSQYLADKEMGVGINLGNTMEAGLTSGDRAETAWAEVSDLETAWHAPITTQAYIDEVHSYGINTLRIPVAWSNMVADDDDTYTIDSRYLDRVEEIVNYALNDGMYVVINDHWDSQWWGQFGACTKDADGKKVENLEMRANAWKRYEAYWTQISDRFKDYSDHLIFEGANEELGERLNDAICSNGYASAPASNPKEKPVSGNLTTDELFDTTNKINQKFVDIVRGSATDEHPNNKNRHLLIPGYNTEIDKVVDARYKMPTDIEENGTTKLFLSVHYYTPWDFCGDGGTGKYSVADQKATVKYFESLQQFKDAGYAIIVGECGICNPAGVESSVTQWLSDTFTEAQKLSAVPVLWDTGAYFDRATPKMNFQDIAIFYNTINGTNGDTSMTRISGGEPSEDDDNSRPIGKYIDKELWAKKGVHAYLSYQTSAWDYRDAYKPFRKLDANATSYEFAKASGAELSADTKVVDVLLDHDGEYTVSIDGADWSGGNSFRMLSIATDLDSNIYKDSKVTATNATVKFDGVAANPTPGELVNKSDDKYYNFMAVNIYNTKVPYLLAEANENELLTMPQQSIEITFTISGLSKVLADIADGTYIDPQTGEAIGGSTEPIPSAPAPIVVPTVAPTAPAPTVVPSTAPAEVGAKVNSTVKSGSTSYKVTKAATTAGNGTVTLTALSKKDAAAKSVTVASTIKVKGVSYKVGAISAKAFKNSKATSITLSKNITKIPASAFANCKKLSKMTVNGKLTRVAKNAFKGCKKTITVKGGSAKVRKANIKLLKKSRYKKFK